MIRFNRFQNVVASLLFVFLPALCLYRTACLGVYNLLEVIRHSIESHKRKRQLIQFSRPITYVFKWEREKEKKMQRMEWTQATHNEVMWIRAEKKNNAMKVHCSDKIIVNMSEWQSTIITVLFLVQPSNSCKHIPWYSLNECIWIVLALGNVHAYWMQFPHFVTET